MVFNLINEKWIPVKRKDGSKQLIRPWEVTKEFEANPVISIETARPDFNGSLIQFLIGLVQTTMAPKNKKEWREKFDKPPNPEALKSGFEKYSHAFNLDGEGQRFMQDFEPLEDTVKEKEIVDTLLIEFPGKKTIEDNTDHFVKRNTVSAMCYPCVVTALFTLQTNAPGGGRGHMTSLRGGGPLTTLVFDQVLWKTLWLNVLVQDTFFTLGGNMKKLNDSDIFPWLAPTRCSEKNTGRTTTPEDMHPYHVFWGMPRRIRLDVSNNKTGNCDICGNNDKRLINYFIRRPNGIDYKGPWFHPLTSHSFDEKSVPNPQKGQQGGIGYRHWLGLVQEDAGSKNIKRPATVVKVFINERKTKANLRLWAFGYGMDKKKLMKTSYWHDSMMPLVLVDDSIRLQYEKTINSLVLTANEVADSVRFCIKKALFADHKKVKKDFSDDDYDLKKLERKLKIKGDFSFIDFRFWQSTEEYFYNILEQCRRQLSEGIDLTPLKLEWLNKLRSVGEKIFDDLSQTGQFEVADPKRIALAWNDMRYFFSNKNRKLREILNLPQA